MTNRRLGTALGVLPLLFGALFFVYPVAAIMARTLSGQALYDAVTDGSRVAGLVTHVPRRSRVVAPAISVSRG